MKFFLFQSFPIQYNSVISNLFQSKAILSNPILFNPNHYNPILSNPYASLSNPGLVQDVQTITWIEFLGILSWLISPPVPSDSNTRDSINISQCLHKVSHCEHIIQIESEIMCDVTIIMWIWMPWPGSQSYLFEIFGPNTAQLQIKPTKKQPISDQIMQIMVN